MRSMRPAESGQNAAATTGPTVSAERREAQLKGDDGSHTAVVV